MTTEEELALRRKIAEIRGWRVEWSGRCSRWQLFNPEGVSLWSFFDAPSPIDEAWNYFLSLEDAIPPLSDLNALADAEAKVIGQRDMRVSVAGGPHEWQVEYYVELTKVGEGFCYDLKDLARAIAPTRHEAWARGIVALHEALTGEDKK